MANISWIKIKTDIFDDEKIKVLDSLPDRDAIFVIWIKLLTLAGKINDKGQIYLTENMPYTDEMLSTIFNRPISTIKLALGSFEKFGMIEINQNFIGICNWEKHQNVDALDKIREKNRLRVQKHRQLELSNDTVTLRNAVDIDKNRIEKSIVKESKVKYSKYYDEQIANLDEDDMYIGFIEFLFGENETGNKLSGLLSIPNQISRDDFYKLYNKAKIERKDIKQILLSIDNTKKYYQGKKNLYLTVNNWLIDKFTKN
jgi:predicted phage replisome organizer